jgi:hypothetical protein
MPQASAQVPTPLGNVKFQVEFSGIPTSGVSVSAAPFQPKLPPGMSVLACYGVVLRINVPNPVADLRYQALLQPTSIVSGGASTGEGLEAQEWNGQDHVLLIGTEDREYLMRRLPHSIVLPNAPFTYSPESLSIDIAKIPAGQPLSLHFIVAWNELPETIEQSCWFAVDQPHNSVLSVVGANPALKVDGAKRAAT